MYLFLVNITCTLNLMYYLHSKTDDFCQKNPIFFLSSKHIQCITIFTLYIQTSMMAHLLESALPSGSCGFDSQPSHTKEGIPKTLKMVLTALSLGTQH